MAKLPRALLVAASLCAVIGSYFSGSDFAANLIIWVAINVLMTASFRFVLLIGELNFAMAGFVGIGAYAGGIATTMYHLPLALALLLGAAAAGLISLVVGFVTLRAKGAYFLLVSFAFTEVLRLIYSKVDVIGGNSGMIGIFPPAYLARFYPAIVVLVVLFFLFVLYRMERSDFGKILVAIRNNDDLVQTVGIDVHLTKVWCLGIASFVTGICGALLAHANNVISPGDFSFLVAVYTLAYLKVGGESHILGAVLGAIVLTLLAQYALGFGAYEHIFYGAAIVIGVLLLPDGLFGLAQRMLSGRRWPEGSGS
ncbi:MAG: branched-chain amino acid ABC transporter permease [Betaproteobacteria bacterium]|nr:MAG: branched-chain amino acid ABC transporter permease [Betaproteobacteria bacterium]